MSGNRSSEIDLWNALLASVGPVSRIYIYRPTLLELFTLVCHIGGHTVMGETGALLFYGIVCNGLK